jgi:hypothetical protein
MTTGNRGRAPLTFSSRNPTRSFIAAVPAPFFLALSGTETLASKSAIAAIATFVFLCRQPSSADLARPVAKYFDPCSQWGMRKS